MISVYKSHSLEILGKHLADFLGNTKGRDPFAAPQIVVPNLETSRWLKLLFADHNGFTGNLDFMFPAEWQWRQVRKRYPELPGVLPSDSMPMSWSLFSLLQDKETIASFPRLEAYVKRQDRETSEQAVWRLSRQIASVFDQYLVYRPELIARWQNGCQPTGDEAWQASLWKILDKNWKSLEARGIRKNRSELYLEILHEITEGNLQSQEPLYVFNPGLVPVPVLKLIKETGRYSEVNFFMIEPADNLRSVKQNPVSELLESMGIEAFEVHGILEEILTPRYPQLHNQQNQAETNLNRLQQSVIRNEPIPDLQGDDGSVHIRSCHSELREVETLHRFLLECFHNDPALAPDDVLVAMPDPERYSAYIKAVFGTDEPGLPHIPFYISSTSPAEPGMKRAFEYLLKLPDSRFTYRDIMDFIQLPPVLTKFDLSQSAVEMLNQWFRDNHVSWGLNGKHRGEEDQPEEELQTWKAALRRGWWGQLTGGEPGELNNGILPYRDVQTREQQQVWAAFSKILAQLESFRHETGEPRSCREWTLLAENWVERFLADDEHDSYEKLKLVHAIDKVRKEAEASGSSDKVPFSIIRSVLNEALDETGSGAAMFTRGVVFSSMVPVRSIPFKVIALLGLNDDVFPRKPVHPDFDLMAQNPKKGERNRKNEDRNLFLESVLAAGKIHYCSYIGRSQKDDEPIPPSPVLSEWLSIVGKALKVNPDNLVTEERLYEFSPDYFTGEPTSWSELKMETARMAGKGESSGLSLKTALPEPEEKESVDLTRLERFYGNPVKGFLAERLGIHLRDAGEEPDEFTVDGLETHILFQRVMGWKLSGMGRDQIKNLLLQSGVLPAGWPGEIKFKEIVTQINRAIEEIRSKGFTIGMEDFHIDICLPENKLEGRVKTFSKEFFLDINPSGVSGKGLFETWVRHLCLSAQFPDKGESVQLCNLKKKKVKWHRFKTVDNPRDLLEDLLAGYSEGLLQPLMFFPKTAFEYIRKLPDEAEASAAAEKAWSNYLPFLKRDIGECNDPCIQLLAGNPPELKLSAWKATFRRLMQPMVHHLEELE